MPSVSEDGQDERKFEEETLAAKLLKTRTVVLSGEINKKLAEKVCNRLLLLDTADPKKPIRLFIDSPGGDADAGYAVFDMIRFIRPPVYTIANGLAASAGVIVVLASPKKHRFSFPNSRWLIHQPSSGMMGVAADIKIHAEEIVKLRARINELIAEETGHPLVQVQKDTDRDRWLSAEEAREYGLVSKIVTKNSDLPG